MSYIAIVLIGFGLAMDCFAVSISCGITMKKKRLSKLFRISFLFGLFQGMMPVIGWFTGLTVKDLISAFDHWIAFGLLTFIGGKMIYESFKPDECKKVIDTDKIGIILILAIATSIDALAVGLSFALLDMSIILPVIIIGVITFIVTLLGLQIGNKFGILFGKKIEILGGLILIGIGLKILIEHLLRY